MYNEIPRKCNSFDKVVVKTSLFLAVLLAKSRLQISTWNGVQENKEEKISRKERRKRKKKSSSKPDLLQECEFAWIWQRCAWELVTCLCFFFSFHRTDNSRRFFHSPVHVSLVLSFTHGQLRTISLTVFWFKAFSTRIDSKWRKKNLSWRRFNT